MPVVKRTKRAKLPGRFEDLAALLMPRAIAEDEQYDINTEMLDRLMNTRKLTRGQESYMFTLLQLVRVYEAEHHRIKVRSGIATLRHLLNENGMNASDLARLLGVHASMGSKILNRERALTVDHLRVLTARFKVRAEVFLD